MANKRKVALIVLGTLVAVLVCLVVLASVLITPERVRDAVVPLAEDVLHRQVKLEGIDVSIFSGITLQNVAIRDRNGQGDFVSADRVVLRYSLLKLLMLKVEIGEITLIKPRVEVVRNRDGSFNFSDLAGDDAASGGRAKTGGADGRGSINFLVSSVTVSDGQILFVDEQGAGPPKRHDITSFNLSASNVSASGNFPYEVSGFWNGNAFGMKGSADPVGPATDLDVRFNRVSAHLSCGLEGDRVKASVALPETSLADILASAPEDLRPGPGATDLRGTVKFSADIDDDKVTTSGFVVNINDQVVRLELDASRIYDEPVLVHFKADSEALVVDRILPSAARPGQGVNGAGSKGDATAKEIGPFDIPLDLTGTIRIGKAVYNRVAVTDLQLKLSLKKNILKLEKMTAAIAGGLFNETGSVNLGVKGLKYATEIDMQGIRGQELVQLVKPELSDTVQGTVDGEMKLSGAGSLPAAAKRNLSGQGTLRLSEGKLQNIPALNDVATLLDIGDLRDIVLDDGTVNFSVRDGQVDVDSRIAGPTTQMTTTGQVDLGGKLNLSGRLALSPELGGRLREQGRLSRYLGDEKGWTTVPLRIKGSYDSPDVALDSKALKKQAESAVKKEVQKSLEKELQKGLDKLFGN